MIQPPGPSPIPKPPKQDVGKALQSESKGGMLESTPAKPMNSFFAFFANLFSFSFFTNRSEKKAEIQALLQHLESKHIPVNKQRLEKTLNSFNSQDIKILNQTITQFPDLDVQQTYNTLMGQTALCASILSSAATKEEPTKFIDRALKIVNKYATAINDTSNKNAFAESTKELIVLKTALKLDGAKTKSADRLSLQTILNQNSLTSSSTIGIETAYVIGQVYQSVLSNPKALPNADRETFKHQANAFYTQFALTILNQLCYGGIAPDLNTALTKLFATNPTQTIEIAEKLKTICDTVDRAQTLEEKIDAAGKIHDAWPISMFEDADNMPTILKFGQLLSGRHVPTNSQIIDNALARVYNLNWGSRPSPVPIFDSNETFTSSALQAQVDPNTTDDTKTLAIAVVDSFSHASVRLNIPLPTKENGQSLSQDEQKTLFECCRTGVARLDGMSNLSDEMKVIAKDWIPKATDLYAQARQEVQIPTLTTTSAKNKDALVNSIELGRVYARKGGQLALTQAPPQVHADCTVIDNKTLQTTDQSLFDNSSSSFKDGTISITLKTPGGPATVQLEANSKVTDHEVSFYVLTSTAPNDKKEMSYFMRKTQQNENDASMHQRMLEEKFLESHLLKTQALCIKTQSEKVS